MKAASARRTRRTLAVLAIVSVAVSACVDRLPDQDRRILAATAITKIPAEDLFKEFQADQKRAHDSYWGKALEVSGSISNAADTVANVPLKFLARDGNEVVVAKLLDDQAAAILAEVKATPKIRLKCYCAGYDGKVQLTSCVKP